MAESKTTLKGRDARNGQFIPVKVARSHPSTTVVERVPKSGYGDTKKKGYGATIWMRTARQSG